MFKLIVPANVKTNGHMPSLLDDGFFSDFFSPEARSTRHTAWPAVDIHELKDKFVLRADIPGVEEKNIRIEGMRSEEDDNQEYRVLAHERAHCQFKRTFVFGDGVEADKTQAAYKNGTLTVEIPKAERAIPRTIPISISNKH